MNTADSVCGDKSDVNTSRCPSGSRVGQAWRASIHVSHIQGEFMTKFAYIPQKTTVSTKIHLVFPVTGRLPAIYKSWKETNTSLPNSSLIEKASNLEFKGRGVLSDLPFVSGLRHKAKHINERKRSCNLPGYLVTIISCFRIHRAC